MRFFQAVAFLSALCALGGVTAATPPASSKSTTKSKTVSKTVVANKKSTGSAVKSAAVKTAAARSNAVKGKTTKKAIPAATWRTRQQVPTPDRYKEIQQALVDKGYLKGEPSGVWDSDSVDAMQRFQMDQKMTPTGKINAPSLIGLGLGAKSAGAPEAAPLTPAPVPAAPPAPAATPPQ